MPHDALALVMLGLSCFFVGAAVTALAYRRQFLRARDDINVMVSAVAEARRSADFWRSEANINARKLHELQPNDTKRH